MRRIISAIVVAVMAACCCTVGVVATAAESLTSWFGFGWFAGCSVDAGAVAADLEREYSSYGETEIAHAVTIYITGADLGLSERAVVIAVATAMQESGLENLANPNHPASLELPNDGTGYDHDSLGLFQQRPASGWGTVSELMDPATAATKFYNALTDVEDWETRPLTEAAQLVQRSAFPDAYAKHEDTAAAIVQGVTARINCNRAAGSDISAEGWTHPLPGHVVTGGFRTAERPTHQGVDLPAGSGTPILTAGPGEVVKVRCNAHTTSGGAYSCDVDGSPDVRGCGWYVEIAHPDGTLTRYCHMRTEPPVAVGDSVAAGQVIGEVGSSGHSSGPHLHYETHNRAENPGSDSAVPPLDFMAARGVQLGEA
ncbi:M23 family metallopeptidase [Glycomyces buryatensis]|uniref:M23 family metallopeptidase n=1 Tax=Glycomyces buryatensis TaxID=2570927 RepID=A0A4S8Q4Z2_9ACTN|nr:M23 family metallopeptidase [Glycomyces buryatensis]THV35709.1 M23 family metallopeptidase [Glycomyces buryatensis]